ncbi:AAA family ATPase [Microbacterium sp. A93]|uniref:AAA family ATPase n=1 Tax=Microbacterium sp. A93 TaxID=3450716 RepID=UPI003F420226
MRLHSLEIEGFGPFRERQIVDFDSFADDGIFLIAGRTGAGKSSILDAVCFGLYGGVPRYESGDKRLRSDHCDPEDLSEVVVEFSTTAGRYRVTRSPEYMRPAKRGGGLTKQASGVQLDTLADAGWVTLAAKEREVGHELDEILQLSREQFLQVILLAQNRFARFLLADSKERQTLLRRLFGTERFEDVQSRFDDRRKTAENALSGRLATVNAGLQQAERMVTAAELWGEHEPVDASAETTPERLEHLRVALERAEYQVERRSAESTEAETRNTAAEATLTSAREERKAQQDRDAARVAMQRIDAEEPEIASARTTLQRARTAEALRATLNAAERAASDREIAEIAERAAREAWVAADIELVDIELVDIELVDIERGEVTAGALEAWAEERTSQSGEWKRAAELERSAPALAVEQRNAEEQVAAASALVAAHDTERAELPARVTELTAQRDAARRSADRVDDLHTTLNAAKARRDAAVKAERLRGDLDKAERALVAASSALDEAQLALTLLRRRRLDGFAGELATALIPGEACTVCGATEHPSPAEHSDPVSPEDVEAAEVVRDTAAQGDRAALDRVSDLKRDLAAAAAMAEERSVAAAEDEVAAATAVHAAAQAAVGALAAAIAALGEATARSVQLEKDRAAAADALAKSRETLALIAQRSAEAQTVVTAARGSFGTVAERIAEVTAHVAAAHALADALEESARREVALTDAAAEQTRALAASDFDGATAAREALRSAAEQQGLEERITGHTVQREKQRELLLALEMRALPEEPIELSAVEESAAVARTVWKAAIDAAGRAETTVDQLSALIASAAAEYASSAAQQADFEVLKGLADTIAGRAGNTHKMTLETFVLAAELEEIVGAANRRLSDMSTGRYQLQHSDALAARGAASGLGIVVFDAFTGQTRPAQSLSGGETFLSSLALALGLAEVVTARAGGIQLDTLFIDEGFGSLDADTLEIAMRTLDELRSGGRTVGIISHVESMQEQIPAQLVVEQTASGPSRIRPAL